MVDKGKLVHATQVDHHRLIERRRGHPLQRALKHLDGVTEVPRVHEAQRLVVQGDGIRRVHLQAALVLPHCRRIVLGHDALEGAVASEEVGVRGVVGRDGFHVSEDGRSGGEVADLKVGIGEAGEQDRVVWLAGGEVGDEGEGNIELAVGEVIGGEEGRDEGVTTAPLGMLGVGAGADGGEEGVEAVEREGAVGEEKREESVKEAEEEGRRRAGGVRME